MVNRTQIEQLINPRLNEILLIAEAALPAKQFPAFRKLVLNQFGKSGLGKDLERLFGEKKFSQGKVRAGIH